METSETSLLSQLSESDPNAFRIIYARYWPELYCAACRRLADIQMAEDAVQEVFFRLWDKRGHLKEAAHAYGTNHKKSRACCANPAFREKYV